MNKQEVAIFGANFLLNDFKGILNKRHLKCEQAAQILSPFDMSLILLALYINYITRPMARDIISNIIDGGLRE